MYFLNATHLRSPKWFNVVKCFFLSSFQDFDEQRNENELDTDEPVNPISHKPVQFNYPQILHYVRTEWLKVETDLANGAPKTRYYQRRSDH